MLGETCRGARDWLSSSPWGKTDWSGRWPDVRAERGGSPTSVAWRGRSARHDPGRTDVLSEETRNRRQGSRGCKNGPGPPGAARGDSHSATSLSVFRVAWSLRGARSVKNSPLRNPGCARTKASSGGRCATASSTFGRSHFAAELAGDALAAPCAGRASSSPRAAVAQARRSEGARRAVFTSSGAFGTKEEAGIVGNPAQGRAPPGAGRAAEAQGQREVDTRHVGDMRLVGGGDRRQAGSAKFPVTPFLQGNETRRRGSPARSPRDLRATWPRFA